ncbi:MAG: outer membrane beta-barrel protein [Aeromonas veronii]
MKSLLFSPTSWSSITASMFFFSSLCAADTPSYGNLYGGVDVGLTNASDGCEPHAVSCDKNTAGGGLFVGYRINEWLAVEAEYDYIGQIKATYPALAHSTQQALYQADIQGFAISAKPYWNIDDTWSLFGILGSLRWAMDVTGNEVNFAHHAKNEGWSPVVGTGVEYTFSHHWSTRLEYLWINNVGGSDTGGTDLHRLNLGVAYHFGEITPPPSSRPPETTTVTPDTSSAPQQSSDWSVTIPSFNYDSAALNPQQITALQSVLTLLKTQPEVILQIHAHTDGQGTSEYNKHLSNLRAQSVLSHLITHGIPANRLSTRGMGESYPVAYDKYPQGREKNRRVELRFSTQTVDIMR